MSFEDIKAKRIKSIEKASQAIGVVTEQASVAVDEFFAEQAQKALDYVPKKLLIKQLPVGLYQIKYEDGGNVPEVLAGSYTTIAHAEKAIANYLTFKNS